MARATMGHAKAGQKRFSRVAEFRQTVDKVVTMLTERGLTVTQVGVRAYVSYHPTTGLPRSLNIPYIPEDASDEFIGAIRGFIDHEVAHVLFTDGPLFVSVRKRNPKIKHLVNIVEDLRIERAMQERFPGAVKHIDDLWTFISDEEILKAVTSAKTPDELHGALLPSIIHAWGGKRASQDFMDRNNLWPQVAELTKRLASVRSRLAGRIADCQEVVEIAEKMLELLKKPEPPAKPSKPEEPSKPEPKKDDKPESSSKEDEDSNASSDGAEDDKFDDAGDDKSDDADDKGGDDNEGEPGDDNEGDDAEGDDAEGDDNEGDDAEGDDAEGDDAEGDDADSADDGDDGGESGNDDASDVEGGEAPDHTPLPEDRDMSDLADKVKDMEESLKDSISKKVAESIGSFEYVPYSKDNDIWTVADPKPGGEADAQRAADAMDKETEKMTGQMANHFRRLFAQKDYVIREGMLRRGRLDTRSLHRLAVNDDRVFYRREEHHAMDTAVTLLCDCSGSMSGSKISMALSAANAFSQTLDRVSIVHEVLGFTTRSGGWSLDYARLTEGQMLMGRPFSRIDAVNMLVFKTFQENYRAARVRLGAMRPENRTYKPASLASNVDGESVEYAAMRLMQRREQRKVMIVFSDGQPAAAGDHSHLEMHLKKVVASCELMGIEMLGIGIMDDSVRDFYPKRVVVRNLEDLPTTVMKELSRILLR